jgi:hypothetical protein
MKRAIGFDICEHIMRANRIGDDVGERPQLIDTGKRALGERHDSEALEQGAHCEQIVQILKRRGLDPEAAIAQWCDQPAPAEFQERLAHGRRRHSELSGEGGNRIHRAGRDPTRDDVRANPLNDLVAEARHGVGVAYRVQDRISGKNVAGDHKPLAALCHAW